MSTKILKHPSSRREPHRGDRIADDFGEIVAQRRHDMGVSQARIAARMTAADRRHPVSGEVVGGFERGERVHFPRPCMLYQWASALDLTYAEMFEAAYGGEP